jgi:hypothetical protein
MTEPQTTSAPLDAALEFITRVWGSDEALAEFDGELVLFSLPEREAFGSASLHSVAEKAVEWTERKSDVYLTVAAMRRGTARKIKRDSKDFWIRGGESDAVALPAIVADFDLDLPDRKKLGMFRGFEEIVAVIDELPFRASELVMSGGGVQAWWKLREPMDVRTELMREEAKRVTQGWHRAVSGVAARKGRAIDATHDLARVFRLPGTMNRKRGEPVLVELIRRTESRINPSDALAVSPQPEEEVFARLSAERAGVSVVGSLALDPNASPPTEKLEAITTNLHKFKATWEHRRKDISDESLSGYDMSLANQAVSAGWADQEVANLLIAHRRKYGGDLKLRENYYRKTIDNARESSIAQQLQSEIAIVGVNRDDPTARGRVVELFSNLTSARIARIITYPPERKVVTLIFADGRELHSSIDDLMSWITFWRVLRCAGFSPKTAAPRRDIWLALVNGLYEVAEEVVVEAGGYLGVVAQLVVDLVSELHVEWRDPLIVTREEDRARALTSNGAFLRGGSAWVRLPGLSRLAVDRRLHDKYRDGAFLKAVIERDLAGEKKLINARAAASEGRARFKRSVVKNDDEREVASEPKRRQVSNWVYGVKVERLAEILDAYPGSHAPGAGVPGWTEDA